MVEIDRSAGQRLAGMLLELTLVQLWALGPDGRRLRDQMGTQGHRPDVGTGRGQDSSGRRLGRKRHNSVLPGSGPAVPNLVP